MPHVLRLEDPALVNFLKSTFAPEGGAEREHNAAEGCLGFGSLHYALIRNLRPRRVLVIGSRYGFVPAIAGLALRANGGGTVDFVDANYDDGDDGFEVASPSGATPRRRSAISTSTRSSSCT